MRKIGIFAVFLILFVSCSSPENCFKSRGEMQSKTLDVSHTPFSKIEINPGITLVVEQADDYSVVIESGKNIIDDISVEFQGDKLVLKEDSGCNFTRAYNGTTVYVKAPFLEEIYSNSDQLVKSVGVLRYPILRLFSMDFFGGVGTGDFDIEVENYQVVVESNHVATIRLKGTTNEFLSNIYNGNGRIEAQNLRANEIRVFHRGTNDMILNPIQKLYGNLYSTGNVIYVNQPETPVDLQIHYRGNVIYSP